MSTTYNIIDSIATHIEGFLWFETPLTKTATHCDNVVCVETTRPFRCDDLIFIATNTAEDAEDNLMEQRTVRGISTTTITLDKNLSTTYTKDVATVAKSAVTKVHRGEPPHIAHYGAITVNLVDMEQKPLTLGSIQDTYTLEIKTLIETKDYERSYKWLHDVTSQIQEILTLTKHPLIKPFRQSTLAIATDPTDLEITVVDPDFLPHPNEILFDDGGRSRIKTNYVDADLGDGVLQLRLAVGRFFDIGTLVIMPLHHVFWSDVTGTTWDDATDGKKLLKTSTVKYQLKIAKVIR